MKPAGESMIVHVNDTPYVVTCGTGLLAILEELALAGRQGVAVAVNGTVVQRASWIDRELHAGDRVLVIQASQGG